MGWNLLVIPQFSFSGSDSLGWRTEPKRVGQRLKLKYPDLVYENSTKAFKTDKEKGCSHWLLEIQNQFWQTRFYPSPSNLAIVANGSNEVKIRTQIMNRAIAKRTSRWEALEQYAKAIRASP